MLLLTIIACADRPSVVPDDSGLGQDSDSSGSDTAPDAPFRSVAVGNSFSCALNADTTVGCWGLNHDGRADGVSGPGYEALSVAHYGGCAVADGSLRCWGQTDEELAVPDAVPDVALFDVGLNVACWVSDTGALDCGGTGEHAVERDVLALLDNVVEVEAGTHSACVSDGNRVVCSAREGTGVDEVPDDALRGLTAGLGAYCGLDSTGRIVCWGASDHVNALSPPSDAGFDSVEIWSTQGCGVTEAGAIRCFGEAVHDERVLLPPEGAFTQIAVGLMHACGLTAAGNIECWGDNTHGQLDVPE